MMAVLPHGSKQKIPAEIHSGAQLDQSRHSGLNCGILKPGDSTEPFVKLAYRAWACRWRPLGVASSSAASNCVVRLRVPVGRPALTVEFHTAKG